MPDPHKGLAALRAGRGAASRCPVRSAVVPPAHPLPPQAGGLGVLAALIYGLHQQGWDQNPATRSSAW